IGAHLARALGCSRRAGELQECGTRRPSQESDAARYEIVPCPREAWNDGEKLAALVAASDVVVHLAGMNRGDERLIHETNTGLADRLADALARSPRGPHVVYASSTHRDRATAYGRSKKYGEERL